MQEAPQMTKSDNEPQSLQASQADEQMLEGNQFNGVYGLLQRWALPSTHEGWEEVQEESSSSDESNKKFTTRMGSSSNTCFMAKGMESDVSDDDSDSPSIDEIFDLVHEHQKVIKK